MLRALLLSTGLAALVAHAQTISAYRYWFDDDAASASTQAVGAGAEYTLATSFAAASLSPGYHRITVQLQDSDGFWSVPQTSLFARSAGPIAGYRYWINDDVSTLVTASVTAGNEVVANTDLALPSLTRDFNSVTVQFRDDANEWSVPYTTGYTKNSGPVSGYEYWIDDAIASSTSGTITPNTVVDLVADLPTATTSGTHLFTIRFSGEADGWSVPLNSEFSFFTSIAELPGLSDLLLFPDPTNDQLTLRLSSLGTRQFKLSILDMTGRVVRSEEPWTASGTAARSWDLDELPAGTYGLRILCGDHHALLRFVKH